MEINWVGYFVIVGLICLNAFFAASEIAIITIRKTRVRQLADEGKGAARSILRLTENTSRFLATIQVGATLTGFFVSAFGAVSLTKIFESWFKAIPIGFISGAASSIAFVVVTVFIAFLTLIFGELIPKTLAIESAESVALLVSRPIEFLSKLTSPIVLTLTAITNFFVRMVGSKRKATMPSVSEEEIVSMVETGHEAGMFEKQESEIIGRVFEFTDLQVRAIMVPRVDVHMLNTDITVGEAAIEILASGYSRYPVYAHGNREEIVGVVYIKDILKCITKNEPQLTVGQICRTPYFIPGTKRVGDLLAELQKSRTQLALVIDEYGGVVGMVTLEDCLEEIVGEIQDEFDAEEKRIKLEVDGTYLVDGATPLNDLLDTLDLHLNDEEVDTIGGLVLKKLGRIAVIGDMVEVNDVRQVNNPEDPNSNETITVETKVTITVERMEGLRIRQVRLKVEQDNDQESGG